MNRVLVVDDDSSMRAALETRFLRRGWRVETASHTAEALEKFRREPHPLIITDIRMPGRRPCPAPGGADEDSGFSLMRAARALVPHTAVILLTAFASVPDAVAAMRDGACDYLVKPVSFEQLELAAERILGQGRVQAEALKELAGHSSVWLRALDRARQAAASDADILIEAESGTGKELVARLIHRLSPRRGRPFIAVNCAAFPETLLESELFGHTKGAFTGAACAKPGKFELAHGGTLLLDEVGEIPLGLQPKLLRVLQEREFDRLGDTRTIRVDLRVVATTNRVLAEMVRAGQFRADLYYRLNVIPLRLPPLRERAGDTRELAEYFACLYAPPGRPLHLAPDLLEQLERHVWPGNVRELANCLRRAVALATGPEIGIGALEGFGWECPEARMAVVPVADRTTIDRAPIGRAATDLISTNLLSTGPASNGKIVSGDVSLRAGVSLGEMERKLVALTLEATGGNRSRAAELLGVSLRTVRNKVRSYGLPRSSRYAEAPPKP